MGDNKSSGITVTRMIAGLGAATGGAAMVAETEAMTVEVVVSSCGSSGSGRGKEGNRNGNGMVAVTAAVTWWQCWQHE